MTATRTPASGRIEKRVRVWDFPTRLFHWALVALVLVSWFTGEEESGAALHRYSGEALAGLIVFRAVWGVIGGEHARFANFVRGPAAIAAHVADMSAPSPKRWLGHNPLGGLAVIVMLALVAGIVVTGLFNDGEHNAGPFAGAIGDVGEIHELLFRILQAVVVVHLAGVAFETLKTKDALVPAMITGMKARRADEAASDARRAGPVALVAAVTLGAATAVWLASLPVPEPAGEEERDEERDGED